MTGISVLIPEAFIVVLVATQLRLAMNYNPALRTLMQLQGAYAILAFVARPLYQYIDKPGYGEFLYDHRLKASSYEALSSTTWLAAIGQAALIVGLTVAARFIPSSRSFTMFTRMPPGLTATLTISLLATWLARFEYLLLDSNMLQPALAFGTPLACMLVLLTPSGPRAGAICTMLIAGELLWSLAFASKTPIIAVLAAVLMRAQLYRSRAEMRKVFAAVAAFGFTAFLIIQPLKGIDTLEQQSRTNQTTTAAASLTFLERFDGMAAITDAYFYPSRPWLTAPQFVESAWTSVNPLAQRAPDDSVGLRWTRDVRSSTVPYQFQGVPIAAGPTAEGYVLAGYAGALAESFLMGALITLIGSGLMRSNIFIRTFCAYFAFTTVLYELGILGAIAASYKAAQLAALIGLLLLLMADGRPTPLVIRGFVGHLKTGSREHA